MLQRLTGPSLLLVLLVTSAEAQASKKTKEPEYDGRPLSSWIVDLKTAPAPSGMGPAAKAAVPALIEALNDLEATVRFPVCIALGEIGPDAKDAVPALTRALDDRNDDVAAMARKAILRITGEDPRPPEEE
jgi:hypothetical protein